jgi:hypothetical protein
MGEAHPRDPFAQGVDHMDHCSKVEKTGALLRGESGRAKAQMIIIAAHYGTVSAR